MNDSNEIELRMFETGIDAREDRRDQDLHEEDASLLDRWLLWSEIVDR